jgi:hypothetical protein
MSMTVLIVCSLMASSFDGEGARVAALPEVAAPPLGETQWVAERVRLNGLPMSIKTFNSALDVDDLFHYYESWARSNGMKDTQRSNRGEWQVLALRSTQHFVSIQARQTSRGSEGTIAVSPMLEAARPGLATRFPYPRSVRLVSVQEYVDGDLASEHLSLLSSRGVTTEARAFSELLLLDGWQLARNEPATTILRGHVIEAQRGAEHAVVTLQPDQTRSTATTVIIVIWKKS